MLRISLLGEQVITHDAAGIIRTRSSRTVALVAFLVVHAGSPQHRAFIAGQFWPDSTDAQALTNLRRELHHLRHALGEEPSLVVTPTELCWWDTETCQVDARAFAKEHEAATRAAAAGDGDAALAHATAALGHYRGPLLPGGYEDWLLDARAELEDRCVALCDLVARTRASQGDLRGAVTAGRRRIQLRPLEEIGYRTLMELQADLGDRAGALSTYHHCASVLEYELGVEPDPATRRTLDRLMVQGARASAPPEARPRRSGFGDAELVGRCAEVDRLRGLWRAAASGRPCLALVRGDPGVGKTRLVTEIAAAARAQGAVVASAHCFESSGRLALAPVVDWLRHPEIHAGLARLEPVWRAEVDRLVPAGPGPAAGAGRAVVDSWQRHRFYEGLARALLDTRRPTLLVLDNLQWCDGETLAFVAFCLRRDADAALMVAGTLRGDPLDHEPQLRDWTAKMRATGLLTELSLSPLELAESARLAAAISGRPVSDEDAQLLQATTGGFPLYVVEAVRGGDGLPVGDLTAVLGNRFAQASPAAQGIARLAAAVRRNFSLNLLTEASDLDASAVVRAVDELWRRRIMREFRDGYDFAHDLLRETAYAQISPPTRWLLHRRLAQGLALLHAEDTDPVSAQLAEQYALGGQPLRAVGYYRRAADIAAARFAHGEAIRLHRAALTTLRTLPEGRARDGHELAVLEAMAAPLNATHGYSSPQLREALERSVAIAESQGRRDATLTGLFGLWASSFVQGNLIAAHATASRALAMAEQDSKAAGTAHFTFAGAALSRGRPEEAVRHFELAAALIQGGHLLSIGTRPEVHGRAWSAHAHWLLGHDDQARDCRDGALALARTLDHPYSLTIALAYAAITHHLCGAHGELRATVDELSELCDRYGFAYYREWALVLRGWWRDDTLGIGLARRGIANLKSAGSFARMPYWLSLLAEVSARNGRPDAARTALDAALVGGQARDDLWWIPEVMRLRAVYDEHGAAAVARLRDAADTARVQGSVALLHRCERDLATWGVTAQA